MTHTATDTTLALVFGDAPGDAGGLCDPFAEPVLAKAVSTATKRRSRRVEAVAPALPVEPVANADGISGETYTFRFDVDVPLAERGKCGPKFMKQWKRVLSAQKLSPLVSPKLSPQGARFQLCIAGGDAAAELIAEREREIADELMHLRRDELPVMGEPTGAHPAGWQGVRVWMTFDRHDVEMALAKKPKL